jgi:hypothetical protein
MEFMKTPISPGRLYNHLVADFRAVCCDRCAHCTLPVPTTAYDPHGRLMWALGKLPEECQECERAISAIVRRYQARYDLMDPVAVMNRMREPPAQHRGAH